VRRTHEGLHRRSARGARTRRVQLTPVHADSSVSRDIARTRRYHELSFEARAEANLEISASQSKKPAPDPLFAAF
jgi:hypothetical protein